MKLRVYSDVHNEIRRYYKKEEWTPKSLETDSETILILAGDIDHAKQIPKFLESLASRFKYIIHVAGNHEYYGGSIFDGDRRMSRASELDNVFHLHNESIVLGGQKFFGGTMWTNLEAHLSPMERLEVQGRMNDYHTIRMGGNTGYRRLTTIDTSVFHREFLDSLFAEVDSDTIVVTHHNPLHPMHLKAVGSSYQPGLTPTDYAYGACLDGFLECVQPKAWISGHTHQVYDMKWANCSRLISNCVGYFDETTKYTDEVFEV